MNNSELLAEAVKPMSRVEITRSIIGICGMQVCAVADADDAEILAHCNRFNPSGTMNGWGTVVRNPDGSMFQESTTAPVPCALHPGRVHYRVNC